MDYQITNSLPINGRTVKVIEVFNTVTGEPISFTRRAPFESKDAWVARAFAAAKSELGLA